MGILVDGVRATYLASLRNQQALERRAVDILEYQASRLKDHPELTKCFLTHVQETKEQFVRISDILSQYPENAYQSRDAMTGFAGDITALALDLAPQNIIRNLFAIYAFEYYEIANYKVLIALSKRVEDERALPLLEKCLREETSMAQWLDTHLEPAALSFAERL